MSLRGIATFAASLYGISALLQKVREYTEATKILHPKTKGGGECSILRAAKGQSVKEFSRAGKPSCGQVFELLTLIWKLLRDI